MRARKRSREWTLLVHPGWQQRHVGKCQICGEFCVDTATPEEAREWCLGHARATGDDLFELTAFDYCRAVFSGCPSVNGTPPTWTRAGLTPTTQPRPPRTAATAPGKAPVDGSGYRRRRKEAGAPAGETVVPGACYRPARATTGQRASQRSTASWVAVAIRTGEGKRCRSG
ncbi:DUF7848 domain-containing protein [Streptomyces sp. GS7]|uniref:DUF7848 domain-containing protein n=1 Tax=Streptomyces sp. GS7 TaxID=2692234 RepID=UPI003FA7C840